VFTSQSARGSRYAIRMAQRLAVVTSNKIALLGRAHSVKRRKPPRSGVLSAYGDSDGLANVRQCKGMVCSAVNRQENRKKTMWRSDEQHCVGIEVDCDSCKIVGNAQSSFGALMRLRSFRSLSSSQHRTYCSHNASSANDHRLARCRQQSTTPLCRRN